MDLKRALRLQSGLIVATSGLHYNIGYLLVYSEQGELIKEINMHQKESIISTIYDVIEIEKDMLICVCEYGIVKVNIHAGTKKLLLKENNTYLITLFISDQKNKATIAITSIR
jgi:hypothetical protein